jgi:hypothetical protein
LGFGYLAKTPMLFVALLFFFFAFLALGNKIRAVLCIGVSVISFLLVASPYVLALSRAKGYFTVGDNYKVICGGYICRGQAIVLHWQGEDPARGVPVHPTRKVFSNPTVYEFGSPIKATYPPWYDPAYWNQGLHGLTFDIHQRVGALGDGLKEYFAIFFRLESWVVVAIFSLIFLGRRRRFLADLIREYWVLLGPVLIVFVGYSLITVRTRYLAGFILLLWMCILASLKAPQEERTERATQSITLGVALFSLIMFFTHGFSYILRPTIQDDFVHVQVASHLNERGYVSGEAVGVVGMAFHSYWARLAHLRIVAELPEEEESLFWRSGPDTQAKIIAVFKAAGASCIVAYALPASAAGKWQKIGDTGYYLLDLK